MIDFSGVSKSFTIYHERSRSLKQTAINALKLRPARKERFWALRDVSLRVETGRCMGIIGPNGSGKSTLLKLAAGIYQPTSGTVRVEGQVSTLIELGAGFDPELSGLDNIYLNASLMGLGRTQIRERLDDIIAFSELDAFIDSTIKNYSSGMYMRLGFAIAVHVDPRVLLIDEILAVGDEYFQRKCLAKLQEFRDGGRTILFVSHDLDSVRSFCDRVAYVEGGRVRMVGSPDEVVDRYLADVGGEVEAPAAGDLDVPASEEAALWKKTMGEVRVTEEVSKRGAGGGPDLSCGEAKASARERGGSAPGVVEGDAPTDLIEMAERVAPGAASEAGEVGPSVF